MEVWRHTPGHNESCCLALLHRHQARIVLRGGGTVDIGLEKPERLWVAEACLAKQLQMPADLETSRLIRPGGAVRFDEIKRFARAVEVEPELRLVE